MIYRRLLVDHLLIYHLLRLPVIWLLNLLSCGRSSLNLLLHRLRCSRCSTLFPNLFSLDFKFAGLAWRRKQYRIRILTPNFVLFSFYLKVGGISCNLLFLTHSVRIQTRVFLNLRQRFGLNVSLSNLDWFKFIGSLV